MNLPALLRTYLDSIPITPFPFQLEAWQRYLSGGSGLIHAPTGMGKTLGAWLGPVVEWLEEQSDPARWSNSPVPIRVLWITPLRALAADTVDSLRRPVEALAMPWEVTARTGDTSSHQKSRQKERLPTALVTTPESLSLLLSQAHARERFSTLRAVVVDEWHELLGSKRGVQTELCLARLRSWLPDLRTWGLSATLGNLEEARAALLGVDRPGALIRGPRDKEVRVETIIPPCIDKFPWAGHLGTMMLEPVVEAIERGGTTLLFTNTRSQAELWYQGILEKRPLWEGTIGLHHGSLDRAGREAVEAGLRTGALRAAISTSSLDLGVDFSPVDQVIQVGSPKGIARLMQRAGRSGHRPGVPSRVLCVPTNALELVEFSAARAALEAGRVEAREPLLKPLDLLAQHLVTLAAGGGFEEQATLREVRGTHAFATLTDQEWRWVMDFLEYGGSALRAYPEYRRVAPSAGVYKVISEDVARRHRLTIGTITSSSGIRVKFQRGATLGSVEETFIARLKPGDRFLFGGRTLELVAFRDDTATVRAAKGSAPIVPRWMGGAHAPFNTSCRCRLGATGPRRAGCLYRPGDPRRRPCP